MVSRNRALSFTAVTHAASKLRCPCGQPGHRSMYGLWVQVLSSAGFSYRDANNWLTTLRRHSRYTTPLSRAHPPLSRTHSAPIAVTAPFEGVDSLDFAKCLEGSTCLCWCKFQPPHTLNSCQHSRDVPLTDVVLGLQVRPCVYRVTPGRAVVHPSTHPCYAEDRRGRGQGYRDSLHTAATAGTGDGGTTASDRSTRTHARVLRHGILVHPCTLLVFYKANAILLACTPARYVFFLRFFLRRCALGLLFLFFFLC